MHFRDIRDIRGNRDIREVLSPIGGSRKAASDAAGGIRHTTLIFNVKKMDFAFICVAVQFYTNSFL